MIDMKKRQLEEIESSIGIVKINRNMNAKFACFWTLCGSLSANVLQENIDQSLMIITGIYFASSAYYGIKTCHQQAKILKLKREKKNISKTNLHK